MNDKDLIDRIFDYFEKITKFLYDRDLIKNWFNIISWSTITAALFVLGNQFDLIFFHIIGILSLILVFFYAWHTSYKILDELFKLEFTRVKILLIGGLSVLFQVAVVFFLIGIITTLVTKGV